jgi:hypothetical protein
MTTRSSIRVKPWVFNSDCLNGECGTNALNASQVFVSESTSRRSIATQDLTQTGGRINGGNLTDRYRSLYA